VAEESFGRICFSPPGLVFSAVQGLRGPEAMRQTRRNAPHHSIGRGNLRIVIAMNTIYLLVVSIALVYAALRFRRSAKDPEPTDAFPGFRPCIGFTALDGMQAISLLLENESTADVWAEEIEISLVDLTANNQTAEASCREILKIRQMVSADDVLPISLAGVIYKAAGGPQREYSCTLSSVLRFRVDDTWFERSLENHRIRMLGLTVSDVRRERKPAPQFPPHPEPQSVAVVAAKFK
jgi:hypothetical protein